MAVYVLLSVIRPAGLMAYIIPSALWSFVALTTLYVCGLEKLRQWFNKKLAIIALLVAVFQIVALILSGLFTSFGKSPYLFTPMAIAINTVYFLSALLAMELSRAYLVKLCPGNKLIMGIGLLALLYTFITIPVLRFTELSNVQTSASFIGSEFLPTLAESLLATYLAMLGGPTASIAYLGTMQGFEWFSPILPNPTWTIKALVSAISATIGFLAVNQTVTPATLIRARTLQKPTYKKNEKEAEEINRRYHRQHPRKLTALILVTFMAVAIIGTAYSIWQQNARITVAVTTGKWAFPDLDGDGYVGPIDLNMFAAVYGRHKGQTGYNPLADLDGDGYIGPIDLNIFAANYGKHAT